MPREILARCARGGATPSGKADAVDLGRTAPSGKLPTYALEGHGKLSPAADLPWDMRTREAFKVPKAAHRFAFAYPLAGFAEEAEKNKITLSDDPALFFVAIGGFIFWDDMFRVCGAVAIGSGDGEGSLTLADSKPLARRRGGARAGADRPARWKGRLEPVTLAALNSEGLERF